MKVVLKMSEREYMHFLEEKKQAKKFETLKRAMLEHVEVNTAKPDPMMPIKDLHHYRSRAVKLTPALATLLERYF